MSTVFTICETFKSNESSVASRVCQLLDRIDLATPYTTRQRRSAEDDGFVFTSQDAFNLMIVRDELLVRAGVRQLLWDAAQLPLGSTRTRQRSAHQSR